VVKGIGFDASEKGFDGNTYTIGELVVVTEL
jgi:hypothetical protein